MTTQDNTLGGTFVDGGAHGIPVSTSLTLITCASEADIGNPFYIKDVRVI